MDKQYSVKFFTTFIESLQTICQEHLTFDQVVEVSGYLSVEIDNAQKERYVLSELLQSCGNFISESYCTKAFKTRPVILSSAGKSNPSKRHTEEEKENNTNNSAKSSKPSVSCDDVDSFNASESKRRKLSSKSDDGVPRKSVLSHDRADTHGKKDLASASKGKKGIKSGCIGSRSSSFLASSAKLSSPDKHPEMETLHDFVSNVVESLSSCSKKQHSTDTHPVRSNEELFTGLPRPSTKTSRSSSRSSTSSLDLPLFKPSTSGSFPNSMKSSMQSLLVSSSKSSPRQGHQSTVSKNPTRSSSDVPQDSEDLNVSSLRHLVSKSNENPTELQHRKTGMESDIPPGQAYIEVVDEVKEELDMDLEEDAAGVAGGGGGDDVDTDVARLHDVSEASTSIAGADVPCTVSSSLMLEPCCSVSSVGSINDDDPGNYAISEGSDPEDMDFPDSPIIIELDDDEDESSDDEEREATVGDDSDPFSSVELRKLETFKDYVKFAVKRVQAFLKKKNVRDPVYRIPPKKLDPLLAEFYVTVRNMRGEDFGVSTLKSIQSYLEQYLRENGYPVSITRDEEFANCRAMLATKVQLLRQARHENSNNPAVSIPLTRRDVEKLFKTQVLGGHSAESLINSMWFMNALLFKIKKTISHCAMKWGDITLKVDEYLNEYLELVRPPTSHGELTDLKVYPNNANPDQCFVKMYKRFQMLRPPNMLTKKSPFYLSVDRQMDIIRSEKMKLPEVSVVLRRMLLQAGVQADKQIVKYDII